MINSQELNELPQAHLLSVWSMAWICSLSPVQNGGPRSYALY